MWMRVSDDAVIQGHEKICCKVLDVVSRRILYRFGAYSEYSTSWFLFHIINVTIDVYNVRSLHSLLAVGMDAIWINGEQMEFTVSQNEERFSTGFILRKNTFPRTGVCLSVDQKGRILAYGYECFVTEKTMEFDETKCHFIIEGMLTHLLKYV